MQRIQPGHEVLSLLGMARQNQVLNKNSTNRGLVKSLISAFFIILAVGLILGTATKILGTTPSSAASIVVAEEPVAFIPGQFVTNIINQGYIGNR